MVKNRTNAWKLETKNSQDNRCNGEKLPGCRKLNSIVKLLPDSAIAKLALVSGLKWSSLLDVQHNKHQLHTQTCVHGQSAKAWTSMDNMAAFLHISHVLALCYFQWYFKIILHRTITTKKPYSLRSDALSHITEFFCICSIPHNIVWIYSRYIYLLFKNSGWANEVTHCGLCL